MIGEIPAWIKKAEPIVYLRISNKEQAGSDMGKKPEDMDTLKSQLKIVKQGLKDRGFKMPKSENIFYEVVSGGDLPENRPIWNQAIQKALGMKKRTYIAVKEPRRWARDQTWGEWAYAPLKRAEIPLYATMLGLLTSTILEPRSNEHAFWSMQSMVAESERSIVKAKAKSKVRELRESGIWPAGGPALYPFARQDPLDILLKEHYRLSLPKDEGGLTKTGLGVRIQQDSAPFGPQATWWRREWQREQDRREKLTPEEYQQWYDFRKMVRDLELDMDFDGSSIRAADVGKKGTINWSIKALRRFANGFLAEPYNPLYSMLEDERIEQLLKDPIPNLSRKDGILHTQIVGKKKKGRFS